MAKKVYFSAYFRIEMGRPFVIALWIILLLATKSTLAQGSSSIEWGNPITYADFESEPAGSDTAAANISVTILLGYAGATDGTLKFRVVAVMDKNESWIKKEFRKDHILKHEQGHFDIAQIFALKLDVALRATRYTSRDVQILHDLYDKYLNQMNDVQLRYDKETRGGWNQLAQSKWRRYIEGELAGARPGS